MLRLNVSSVAPPVVRPWTEILLSLRTQDDTQDLDGSLLETGLAVPHTPGEPAPDITRGRSVYRKRVLPPVLKVCSGCGEDILQRNDHPLQLTPLLVLPSLRADWISAQTRSSPICTAFASTAGQSSSVTTVCAKSGASRAGPASTVASLATTGRKTVVGICPHHHRTPSRNLRHIAIIFATSLLQVSRFAAAQLQGAQADGHFGRVDI